MGLFEWEGDWRERRVGERERERERERVRENSLLKKRNMYV